MLQVRLLGQFDILADGKRVAIPARAGQSLFAYLILTAGTVHRREKLAGLIWPDTSDETARRNLRQQLWLIRKALAPPSAALAAPPSPPSDYLRVDEISIGFDSETDFWLDVAQLQRPIAGDDELNDLINKLSLYRGELLPGFYDDWVSLEREHAQSVFEARMHLLMERLVAAERWTAVLEWAEKWLSLGDTSEPAFRALLLAHASRGDLAKVTAIYQRCVAALRDELGVEPSIETRALYDGLVKGAQIPARTQPAQPSGTVTFLFTDIEGSTRLLDRLQQDYATVLHEHHEILRAAVKRWNGHEIGTQGDAFFVTFARATDAIACAVQAQRALDNHAWTQDEHVRVRMGLHTGEPLMATTGYIGMDVHRAARIGDSGHGGQVLLSQTTRDLVVNELPPGVTLRDLGEHRLKDLKFPSEIYQLAIEGLPKDFPPLKTTFGGAEPPAPGDAPFKGLQYFDVQDAPLFFGREALTAKLAERLHGESGGGTGGQMLVVVGASGSGKSSVVRAGIVPALQSERVYIITPTAHPLEGLATALTRDSESITATATLLDDLGNDPRALHLWLRRQNANRELPVANRGAAVAVGDPPRAMRHTLLVVDQFEELFTLCRDEFERQAFVDNLLYATGAAPSGLFTLVLTLRADFYARLAQYPELRDVAARNQEYIGPMTGEELRRAMQEPARRGHWEFEPGLVDLILRDVGADRLGQPEPGALPLLSHALLETWKRRAGHTMTLKGYADAHGVRGAITHTAESVYENLAPEAQRIARSIFLGLTELGEGTEDMRRRASFEELASHTADEQQTRAVLNALADARLITLDGDSAEVAHEALIREWARLREWLNQDREGLRLQRDLTEAAREWELLERDPGALHRGARLARAREWLAVNTGDLATHVNESERAFIAAAAAQEEQEEREKEGQQQRELDAANQIARQAQNLAAVEKQRAEDSTRGATRLRRRAYWLASAFLLALILAGLSLFLGDQARNSAAAADKNAAVADVNALRAESEKRIATARELAAASTNNLSIDPERSILLAMQAVNATAQDRMALTEAMSALHAAIQTSRLQLNLLGHSGSVGSVAVNADGTQAATTSEDGTAKVWDLHTGKELLSLRTNHTFNGLGVSAVFTPDGAHLLTVSDNNSAKLWDLKTGEASLTLTGHTDIVWAVATSPDGKTFATASADRTAKLWDAATGKELVTLVGHDGSVDDIAFGPDGRRVYTGSDDDGTGKAWDAKTGKELFSFSGQGGTVGIESITASPDGTRIATGEFDTHVKIWDAATGQLLQTLFGHASYIDGLAYSADGKYLASGSEDGVAIVWDAATGQQLLKLNGHTSGVRGVAFAPDGTRLVTVSRDGTGKVWDITLAGSRDVLTLAGHADRVQWVVYSPDGTRLASAGADGVVKTWDAASGKNLLTIPSNSNSNGAVVSYSPDGKRLVVNGKDTGEIIDAATGAVILTLAPFDDAMTVVFSPDGTRLATGSAAGKVKIYDSTNGKLLVELTAHRDRIEQVAFSPDGMRLASASDDGAAKVWDVQSGTLLLTFDDKVRLSGIAFSPDGKRIATSSNDATIKVWDSVTGAVYFTLRGHTGATFGVAFSPNGKQLATTSVDRTIKVWTLPDIGGQVEEPLTLLGHTAAVYRAVFSPDGTRLATASRDGTVRIYALPIQDLMQIARTRVTRMLTVDECQKYLHAPQCPPAPQ
ncbi:MAG: adenylate/guanylate cyclase domain-containing protein [Anaerolineae bacterium]